MNERMDIFCATGGVVIHTACMYTLLQISMSVQLELNNVNKTVTTQSDHTPAVVTVASSLMQMEEPVMVNPPSIIILILYT